MTGPTNAIAAEIDPATTFAATSWSGESREHREQRRLHRTRQRHASRRDRNRSVDDGGGASA